MCDLIHAYLFDVLMNGPMKIITYITRFANHPRLAFGSLSLLYTLLIIALPANTLTMQVHTLSSLEYKIISFAIAIPSIIVWLAAFIGYEKLYDYARSIRKSSEGESFHTLARGVKWLAWSLPIPVIVATILNAIANTWPDFKPAAIIISNYTALILPLIGFTFIASASRALITKVGISFNTLSMQTISFVFVTIGVLYCYLTFSQLDLSSIGASNNPYYLPVWLMVLTVIIPYLYSWFLGLLAAYEITLFSRQAKGLLYRRGLHLLVGGLVTVIISAIALQYIGTASPRVGYLELNYKLVLILLFRLLGGVGFVMLIMGAVRLKKIEEV